MPFLQSISNFFSGTNPSTGGSSSNTRHANRRSVMNSTMDAFSLPSANTQRYGNGYGDGAPHIDSASSSPGPSRRGSAMYSAYPPPKDAYDASPSSYPPPSNTFHRLRKALADAFPEILETLNGPADPHLLAAFEAELGCPLPRAVRDSLLVADGQDLEATYNISGSGGVFFGLHLLPLEEVMREWSFWRQAEHNPAAGSNAAVLATMVSVPPRWIKNLYACRGWVPLLSDRTGNYVGVDLDPGPSGAWGQVIVFGRDFDRKCVLWRGDGEGGWGKWLSSFVDELESGEGWEADRSASSDEEDEIGYSSYNGGGMSGEGGRGLRLAGEYRGWNVLEAWWDRSVRRWEGLGLGMDVEEVEKGLSEARRLTGYDSKGKEKAVEGLGISAKGEPVGSGDSPALGSPHIPAAPGTPVPRDSDVLLPPASPDAPPIPKIRHPAPSPVRVITPIATTADHPLKTVISPSGYLSPPSRSPPRNNVRKREPAPAPTPIDLPTRADVQAMSAIAQAEQSGLRGGWVMNLDTSAGAAARRAYRNSSESEMVDIDLEGGKAEKFGSPKMNEFDYEKQREEERLAIAGLEHRRSPILSNNIPISRTPSPLSREASFDGSIGGYTDQTPRANSRQGNSPISPGTGGMMTMGGSTNIIRKPPPIANHNEVSIKTFTPEEERDREVIRGTRTTPRMERESSVVSTDSQDGLLARGVYASGSGSVTASPTVLQGRNKGLEEELEEVSLDAGGI